MDFTFENDSGQGRNTPVPEEIRGWNWGAFFLSWLWGIGNNTFIALLMFVPIVNIVMPFVLGAKGNEWAWQNRIWQSVEQFKRAQKRWAISGFILIFICLPALFFFVAGLMKQNDAYRLSFSELQYNQQVVELVGAPVEAGFFVTGKIHIGGGTGTARISYSIIGPKGEADAHVYAVKEIEGWKLQELVVYSGQRQQRFDLIKAGVREPLSISPP